MVDLILAKRNGKEHKREEIDYLINGIMQESIPDYQLSSWLMAVCWQGLSDEETAWLTDAMSKSGEVLDLSEIGDFVGDKHSTGGVGDKTTLVFVPLMAAAGIPMAKLSGRGLGHTGGTIDKLEAIPGFNCSLGKEQFIKQVKEIKMAVAGQTSELAPADGKIYALRDVTGTVESIPLIAASVMSKKLAAGSNLIILDVKCGRGAFMDTEEKASKLASVMAGVGKALNKPVTAVVTDMEQPLGLAVGHSVEVAEAIDTLKGRGPADLRELCLTLGALAMVKAGKARDDKEARKILAALLDNGEALACFATLVKAQGGDVRVVDDYSIMPTAAHRIDLLNPSDRQVWVEHLDGRRIAEALKLIGAGRVKKGDPINLAVGVCLKAKVGNRVGAGEALATVHVESQEQFDLIKDKLLSAYTFNRAEVKEPQLVKASVS
ncbi:MAG: thymidine phosphorylase [Candidatus Obscuribacterales bacterium]|nr:thymidine phosphorylase [Candidatus Obscuribacterales bacterium]